MDNKIRVWFRGTSFRYWWTVILSVLNLSDVKEDIVSNGRGLLVGFFAALFSYIYRGEYVDLGNISYYALIFFTFSLVFYIGERLVFIPAKLYREKEAEARRISWADIEVKPFTFDRTSGFGVGVEIVSDKPFKKGECVDMPNDTYINRIEQGGMVLFPGEDNPYPLYLPLLGGSNSVYENRGTIKQRDDNSMSRIKETVIPIANWNEDRAWITAIDKKQDVLVSDCGIEIKRNIVCRVVIHAKGRINALEELRGCEIFCDLLYYEDNGKMKMSIKLIERHPEYEL